MATFTPIKNQKQTKGALLGTMLYIINARKTTCEDESLVSCFNCSAYTSYPEPPEGWLGQMEQTGHLANDFISLGKNAESIGNTLPALSPSTWTDSKQEQQMDMTMM